MVKKRFVVYALSQIKPFAVDCLKAEGYVFWAENLDPTRLFFVKSMPPFGIKITFHVHILEPDSNFSSILSSLLIIKFLMPEPTLPLSDQRITYLHEGQTLEKIWPKLANKEKERIKTLAKTSTFGV